MARAALLLRGIDRYPASRLEDRLTEVLASVLRSDPQLVSWMAAQAWPEASAGHAGCEYEVFPQAWASDKARPDIEVRFPRRREPHNRLFLENKITAPPTREQEAGYRDLRPEDGLLLFAPAGYRQMDKRFIRLTWTQLAQKLFMLSRSWGGRKWRDMVLGPDVPGVHRLRHELLDYLEQKLEVTVDESLSHLEVLSYGRATRSLCQVKDLFTRTIASEKWASRLTTRVPLPRGDSKLADTWYVLLDHPWPVLGPDQAGGWPELLVSPEDDWTEDPVGEPAFGVGYTFPLGKGDDLPPAVRTPELTKAFEKHGITRGFTDDRKRGRCFKTLYVAELIGRSDLEAQAEEVACWAVESLELIASQPASSPNEASETAPAVAP